MNWSSMPACAAGRWPGRTPAPDRVRIAGYLGKSERFDVAIADFAEAYADQTEQDHAALCAAVKSGRVAADADA